MTRKTSIPKLHSIRFKDGPLADNVTHIAPPNTPVPVINVLCGAAEEMLTEVVLIGYDAYGREYIAGSTPDLQRAAYMFGRAQLHMLRVADD